MRKLLFAIAATIVLSCLSVGVRADNDGTTLGFTATVKKNNTAVTATPLDLDSSSYDLGFVGLWKLTYSGKVDITTNNTNPSWSLQGNLKDTGGDNFIWQYYYSADNVDSAEDVTNWTCVGSLLNVDKSGSGSWVGESSGDISYGPTISARWLLLDHDATLTKTSGTGSVTAHGTGVMDVSSVPEPGTILAACTILAPAGMFFRRRKR
ncbi:MAG: PEP-CTERM sorting domain-containing protein [Armatimonadota bacterium]